MSSIHGPTQTQEPKCYLLPKKNNGTFKRKENDRKLAVQMGNKLQAWKNPQMLIAGTNKTFVNQLGHLTSTEPTNFSRN